MNEVSLPIYSDKALGFNNPQWDGVFESYSSQESAETFQSGPWHRGDQLTVSFAQDGTRILGQTSTLFESFRWMFEEAQLEQKVLQAFQVWARQTNLNVGRVADGGQPFGDPGLEQRDLRFGDIRIGAIEMPLDVFAVAIPVDDMAAGTWAGDIVFNSLADFSPKKFYHVALHEAGHVFGLEHSDDPGSPMFFGGDSISLTAQDRLDIRNLYGQRRLDLNEDTPFGNNSFADATRLEYPSGSDADKGETPLVAFGDLLPNDNDFFEVNLPSDYSGRLTFRLDTKGLSLLSPALAMYDEEGTRLRLVRSSSRTGDQLVVTVPTVEAGAKYYARVFASNPGAVYSTGSYALGAILNEQIKIGWNRAQELFALGVFNVEDQSEFQKRLIYPSANLKEDLFTNESIATATVLETVAGFADQSRYEQQGSIESGLDRDFYSFVTLDTGGDTIHSTIRIDSLIEDGFIPRVDVFDADANRMRSVVLVNSNGQLSVQVPDLAQDSEYFVRVSTNGLSQQFSTGDYRLTVDFTEERAKFQRFASGAVSVDSHIADHSLHVARSQMLHVNLSSFGHPEVNNAVIWLTIYDELGDVYFRSATTMGQTRSANSILFSPGSYSVKVELALPAGISSTVPFRYLVRGRQISHSQGPKLLDPTESPFEQCNSPSPEYCYPNDNHSTDPFIFVDEEFVNVDPPDTPWVDINDWYWFDDWLTSDVPPNP